MFSIAYRSKSSVLTSVLKQKFSYRSLKTKPTRVRFAPSPTGFLHLGGLRTALYNYLYALSCKGQMILRIEDTDQTRKVEGSVEALLADLDWVGIECNEGPSIGGNYGPYIQSERLDLYKHHVDKLIESGAAYRCFCTERRLDLQRREAMRNRQVPRYDNKCRGLSVKDVEKKLSNKQEFCVRFKLTDNVKSFEDLIFGGIGHDVTLTEGDPVILKSDGWPTYHLANVVDDHFMDITHVLRGVEWQISTTKHIMMYNAFGWTPPRYGHLPLIVNSDGTKLSKRQSDIRVGDYRRNGFFPLALVNFITASGGGFDHVPGSGVQLKLIEELAEEFDIEKVSSHPSRLNNDVLNEFNRLELIRLTKDIKSLTKLVATVQELVRAQYKEHSLELSDSHCHSILKWATNRISNLNELVEPKYAFLWILPDNTKVEDSFKNTMQKLLNDLDSIAQFEQDKVKTYLKSFSEKENLKFNDFMKMLRSALSGLKQGPSVAEMMEILGKETCCVRIKNAIQK